MPLPATADGRAESNLYQTRPAGRFKELCQAGSVRRHRSGTDTGEIVGRSAALQTVLRQIEHVARTDATVLLLGEAGTGKEVLATRLHSLSAHAADRWFA